MIRARGLWAAFCGAQSRNVLSPELQCVLTFLVKLVTLIDRSHPGNRAALVVEDLICHVRRNPEPGHAGDHCPAQIVQRPVAHPRQSVELRLCLRVALEYSL